MNNRLRMHFSTAYSDSTVCVKSFFVTVYRTQNTTTMRKSTRPYQCQSLQGRIGMSFISSSSRAGHIKPAFLSYIACTLSLHLIKILIYLFFFFTNIYYCLNFLNTWVLWECGLNWYCRKHTYCISSNFSNCYY